MVQICMYEYENSFVTAGTVLNINLEPSIGSTILVLYSKHM